MKTIVLLSENFLLREKVLRFCESLIEVDLLKTFADADSVLEWLKFNKPDYVLVDFFLFGYDGLDFLRTVRNQYSFKSVFITPCFCLEITEKAYNYGADRVLEQGFSYEELEKTLSNEAQEKPIINNKVCEKNDENILEEKIARLCVGVGIPPHILGYLYVREAIKIAIFHPKSMSKITKELYPSVAKKFKTTASKVERAIRHALFVANTSKKLENINALLCTDSYMKGEKITSSQFIALVADRLLFQIQLKD